MIFSIITFSLFLFFLGCIVLTHHLGFGSGEELFFLDRRHAQVFFFVFLFLISIISYALWREYRAPIELSSYIEVYDDAQVAMWIPLFFNNNLKYWDFITFDSPLVIKEYYLKKKNREGWLIRKKSEDNLLVLEKGDFDLIIEIIDKKNGEFRIHYVLKKNKR